MTPALLQLKCYNGLAGPVPSGYDATHRTRHQKDCLVMRKKISTFKVYVELHGRNNCPVRLRHLWRVKLTPRRYPSPRVLLLDDAFAACAPGLQILEQFWSTTGGWLVGGLSWLSQDLIILL